LTKPLTGEAFEQRLNVLSRHFAGDTADKETRWLARDAAGAALELERVRLLKTTIIERVVAYGPNPYVVFVTCLVGAAFGDDIWSWARKNVLSWTKETDKSSNKRETEQPSPAKIPPQDP
jgi:hypothetical protein